MTRWQRWDRFGWHVFAFLVFTWGAKPQPHLRWWFAIGAVISLVSALTLKDSPREV